MLLPTSGLRPIRPGRFFPAFATITAFVLWHFYILSSRQPAPIVEEFTEVQTNAETSNSTLGFQTIIAISSEDATKPGAWRQRDLLAAANRTGLDVNVHQSRPIPDGELHAFMQHTSKTGESPRAGSARAWIAHLDALKHVVAHNITTALILEDDADWDVRIRQQLAPHAPIASLVREILADVVVADNTNTPSLSSTTNSSSTPPPITAPFSLAYDILWLGHCASVPTPHSHTLLHANDTTLPKAQRLRALADRYAYTPLPDYTRQVMRSPGPTCTYAYAVTRRGAERILEAAGSGGGGAAFDNEVGAACAMGEKRGGLRCVSVAPELFHHQRVVGGGENSIVDGMNWGEVEVERKGREGELKRKVGEARKRQGRKFMTFNIMYSARCNAERGDGELVQCMPTDEELDRYTT